LTKVQSPKRKSLVYGPLQSSAIATFAPTAIAKMANNVNPKTRAKDMLILVINKVFIAGTSFF
jgi:hypothetical protein